MQNKLFPNLSLKRQFIIFLLSLFCILLALENSSAADESYSNGFRLSQQKRQFTPSLPTISFHTSEKLYYLEPRELEAHAQWIGESKIIINFSGDTSWSDAYTSQSLNKFKSHIVGFDLSETLRTVEDLQKLADFPHVVWLSLENTYLNDDKFKQLPKFPFVNLNISHNVVTADALQYIDGTHMKIFNGGATKLGNAGVIYISQHMPLLESLYMHSCGLEGNVLNSLSKLSHLTFINIQGNKYRK